MPGEHFGTWICRLAAANGVLPTDFARWILGHWHRHLTDIGFTRWIDLPKVALQVLARGVGIDEQDIEQLHALSRSPGLASAGAASGDLSGAIEACCVLCISEIGIFQNVWSYDFYTCCTRHHEVLRPVCECVFNWFLQHVAWRPPGTTTVEIPKCADKCAWSGVSAEKSLPVIERFQEYLVQSLSHDVCAAPERRLARAGLQTLLELVHVLWRKTRNGSAMCFPGVSRESLEQMAIAGSALEFDESAFFNATLVIGSIYEQWSCQNASAAYSVREFRSNSVAHFFSGGCGGFLLIGQQRLLYREYRRVLELIEGALPDGINGRRLAYPTGPWSPLVLPSSTAAPPYSAVG